MYRPSQAARNITEREIGLPVEKILEMDLDEEIAYVERKVGRKPIFSHKQRAGVYGRGNPLLAKRRLVAIDEVNKRLGPSK